MKSRRLMPPPDTQDRASYRVTSIRTYKIAIKRQAMSALGQKRTSLWQQLVRKALHAVGHGGFDTGEIVPGHAWLGCDNLGPHNEEGRNHDEDNGQLFAHR